MWAFVVPDNWNVPNKKKKKASSYIFYSNLNILLRNGMGKETPNKTKEKQPMKNKQSKPEIQPLQVSYLPADQHNIFNHNDYFK